MRLYYSNKVVVFFKMVTKLPTSNIQVMKEIENYEKQLIDIDTLSETATEALREKDDLRNKLDLLEKRVKVIENISQKLASRVFSKILCFKITHQRFGGSQASFKTKKEGKVIKIKILDLFTFSDFTRGERNFTVTREMLEGKVL